MKKHFMSCFNLINKESDEIVLAKVLFGVSAARLDLIKVFPYQLQNAALCKAASVTING